MHFRHIQVRPLSGHLGAEVEGIDLSKPLEDRVFKEIHRAFLDHAVLAFRTQRLAHEDLISFGRRFGDLDIHPIAIGMEQHPEILKVWKPAGERAAFGTSWHSDNTFFENPTILSFLYSVTIPPVGGDTLYASTSAAYRALSQTMRGMIDGLVAVHSASRAYDPKTTGEAKYKGETAITYHYSSVIEEEVEHPVIRQHPLSGRRAIYVNPMFTQRIVGLNPRESDALLQFLYQHVARPDFQCRFRWEAHSIAMWDNRCVQHMATWDYHPGVRHGYRVTLCGDRPL